MSAARRSSRASRYSLTVPRSAPLPASSQADAMASAISAASMSSMLPRRARHAADHAGQHGEAFLAVVAVMRRRAGVDHGEGVEAGGVLAEGDERAAERLRRVLEGPPVVDHHGLAAGADDAGHQLLHQHRLAGARLAGDGDVVVAGLVGEGRPAGRLAPPPDQEEGGRVVRLDAGWPRHSPCTGARLTAEDVSSVFVRPIRSRSASRPPAGAMGRQASQEGSCT